MTLQLVLKFCCAINYKMSNEETSFSLCLKYGIFYRGKLTELLRSRYLVFRVTGIPDKKAITSLLALEQNNKQTLILPNESNF